MKSFIADQIQQAIDANCHIEDEGIGSYDYGSSREVDSLKTVTSEINSVEVDLTDTELVVDRQVVPINLDNLKAADCQEIQVKLSISNGDPSDCADRGKTHCGGCTKCSPIENTFTAKLKAVKITAYYEIE